MNKEQQDLLNEVYLNYLHYTILGVTNGLDRITGHLDNCLVEFDGYYEHFTNPSFAYGFRLHTVEEFIIKIKTNSKFSEKWKLKIEEQELSLSERTKYKKERGDRIARTFAAYTHQMLDNANIPTKLITITHNDKTIESYE
jgi:hypothetical protein